MDNPLNLVELASRFVYREASLDELDHVLATQAASLAGLGDDDLMAQLAGLIEVTLAEMDRQHATEEDLRRRLSRFFIVHGLWSSPEEPSRITTTSGTEDHISDRSVTIGPLTDAHTPVGTAYS